jgi:cob(I)alamin adenosyltransferase
MAINITRVYTRGGDKGKTSLVGGVRIDKASVKLDSYGAIDELNCLVGIARAALSADPALTAGIREELDASLRLIQNKLFDVGSILATPAGKPYAGMPSITEADATALEAGMDAMQASLEPLKSFCLPGGTAANAALHHARAVCRRAERDIFRLAKEEAVDMQVVKYVNRLSDYLFVLARFASRKAGAPEYLWEFGLSSREKKLPATVPAKAKGVKTAKRP